MAVLVLVLLILAAVLSAMAAFGFTAARVNLLAAAFCSFVIAVLLEHL